MHIRVAVRAPARVSPPVAAAGPVEGYFIRAKPPASFPVATLQSTQLRVPPPTAADGPAEGHFARANPSTAIPLAHCSPSGACVHAVSRFSTTSPGRTFAPLFATGLGLGRAATIPQDTNILK